MTHGTMGPQWIADEIRKANDMTDKIYISPEVMDPRCAKCGHPRSNHPYRHPFTGPSKDDTIRAISARVAELEAERDELDFLYHEGGQDSMSAKAAQVNALAKYLSLMLLHVQHEQFARGNGDSEPADSGELINEVRAALAPFKDTTS